MIRHTFLLLTLAFTIHAAMPVSVATTIKPTMAPLIKKVIPAVVNISAKSSRYYRNPFFDDPFFQQFFGRNLIEKREAQSAGSGVIIDAAEGLIVTNYHVIENAESVYVSLVDGRHVEANVKGSDPETDIALLQINADNLVDIEIADSDALEVGDFAIAIGNPFGLNHSVTMGIISALGRTGLGIRDFENFIQTDAPINPGNSGGALIDMEGKLIGLNTAILSRSGGSLGIGFATPSNMVSKIVKNIKKYGYVKRGTLGVEFQDLERELAQQIGLEFTEGAIVTQVHTGDSVREAKLFSGDVILEYAGVRIKNASHLKTLISLSTVGEKERIKLIRNGKTLYKDVWVKDQPKPVSFAESPYLSGVSFAMMNNRVVVTGIVKKDAAVAQLGLQKGDIIESVNGLPVKNLEDIKKAIKQKTSGINLKIRRGSSIIVLRIGF